ncbi:MAG TPA: 4-hydroxy-tetrahydrodipicolinate reductase [Polyangiaceae bacterium]
MRLAIHGTTGRMGLAVLRAARAAGNVEIVGGACAPSDPGVGKDLGELSGTGPLGVVATADVGSALLGADVVVDFSLASVAPVLFATAARQRIAIVSGTTGLDATGERALEKAAGAVPVLWAPNMSLGIQVLAEVVEHAVRRLGPAFDVEIVELHHRRKVDAPSGTAKRLAQAARAARSELSELEARSGDVGARKTNELGVFGIRGGDVVGDHTVFFLGNGDRIEITHRASTRDTFAVGAVRAALWVAGCQPGLYDMRNVLGLGF